jgi:hypothetical protein
MKNCTALCSYRVKKDKDKDFLPLLIKHRPTLQQFGLVTEEPSTLFHYTDESGKTVFVEIIHWKSKEGHKVAEQIPEIMKIWEGMGALVEARLGRPPMEFPFVERIEPT